jgi:hypothetical protein
MSRVCDDCFKKLTTTDIELNSEEAEDKDTTNYSKLQEGVVRGVLKCTPSKADKCNIPFLSKHIFHSLTQPINQINQLCIHI